jgi:hypothetical protein
MARGIGMLQMTDIDPTTVHDEDGTVIIERGMIDVKEMTEGTGLEGTAPDIVIEGTNPAESMLTDDGTLPPIHLAHTTVHHVLQSHPILIEKKARYLLPLPASRPRHIRQHILS